MATIYLIADRMTSWGAGQTKEAAMEDAAQWLCDTDGKQGLSVEDVEDMIISEHEVRNGSDGVYLIEYQAEWPENASSMDGDAWLQHYQDSQEEEED